MDQTELNKFFFSCNPIKKKKKKLPSSEKHMGTHKMPLKSKHPKVSSISKETANNCLSSTFTRLLSLLHSPLPIYTLTTKNLSHNQTPLPPTWFCFFVLFWWSHCGQFERGVCLYQPKRKLFMAKFAAIFIFALIAISMLQTLVKETKNKKHPFDFFSFTTKRLLL